MQLALSDQEFATQDDIAELQALLAQLKLDPDAKKRAYFLMNFIKIKQGLRGKKVAPKTLLLVEQYKDYLRHVFMVSKKREPSESQYRKLQVGLARVRTQTQPYFSQAVAS